MGLRLKIKQGSTYRKQVRWEVEPFCYKPITAIDNTAPCTLHVPDHGLLPDQLFVVQAAQGMVELNASEPHVPQDWYRATVVDKDTVQINRINSLLFKKHTASSGVIKYRSVVDLTPYTARMQIRNRVGGEVLHTLDTALGTLIIDPALQFVSLIIDELDTTNFAWKKGVYDLDLIHSSGTITTILSGDVSVEKESTTM